MPPLAPKSAPFHYERQPVFSKSLKRRKSLKNLQIPNIRQMSHSDVWGKLREHQGLSCEPTVLVLQKQSANFADTEESSPDPEECIDGCASAPDDHPDDFARSEGSFGNSLSTAITKSFSFVGAKLISQVSQQGSGLTNQLMSEADITPVGFSFGAKLAQNELAPGGGVPVSRGGTALFGLGRYSAGFTAQSATAVSLSKEHPYPKYSSFHPSSVSMSADLQKMRLKWTKIFQMQHSEGYWELTTELGQFMNINVDLFANVFLKNKGIHSLGLRAHADILRLVATLLVLQLMRVEKLEEGKLLRTLFCLINSSQPRPERWEEVKRAVDWVCWADRQYPCVYSRLEFGLSWESSTRQLLGYESLPPFSPLSGLNLRETTVPLLVH